MLDPDGIDLEELAEALADQSPIDHRWFIDRQTGRLTVHGEEAFDGEDSQDDDDPDLMPVEPLPSFVWHRDMADFVAQLTDPRAAERLRRALHGPGAFRRFGDELHQRHPHLVTSWREFRAAPARQHP